MSDVCISSPDSVNQLLLILRAGQGQPKPVGQVPSAHPANVRTELSMLPDAVHSATPTPVPFIELNDHHKMPALGLGVWQIDEDQY